MDNEKYGIELELLTARLKQQINSTKTILSNFSKKAKENATIKFDAKTEQLKWKILDLKEELKSIDTSNYVGKRDFLDTSVKLQKLEEELNNVGNESNEVSNNMNKMGNSVQKALDKSTSKMKKFALSLFSIRSIWSLVSRASSNYMAQDKQLSNQITKTWTSLGAILSPIIEKIVQVFRTLIAYVNYFVKALTGKDFIAKAVKKINTYNKSLNKTSKSAKSLNKELTSLDEITNLSFDETKIEDVSSEFDDFSDIKLNKSVTDFLDTLAEKLNKAKELLKPIIDWAVEHPDVVLTILGGAVLLKTLSKLTGGTTTGGLLGNLFGSLKNLAAIGIITIGIKIIYDSVEKIKEASDEHKKIIKDNVKLNKSNTKNTQKLIEIGEKYQKTTKGIDEKTKNYNDTLLKSNKVTGDHLKSIHDQYNWISKLNGSYKDLDKEIYEVVNQEIFRTNALKKSYDTGKLTNEQAKQFKETLKEQIIYYANLAKKTKEGTYENEIYNKRIQSLAGTLKEISKEKYSPKLEVDTTTGEKQKNTFMTNLKKSLKEKFSITISALFKGSEAKSKLSSFFTGVNNFANSIKNVFGGVFKGTTSSISSLINKFLPSFDVGTNYVPNDMVAQIHKGEMIVPAKYNPITSGISGNQETTALLIELNRNILELSKKPTILNVNGKDLAQATYNDFKNEGNRLNASTSISIK